MAMTVMNNPSAMMTLGELNKNISNQGKSAKKLASGMKINSAGDDASAYSISERMRAQLRSLDQDIDNVKNGRALLKVAAGGIDNIVDELRNLKELALNAANDTNTDEDRATIQKEFDQKMANINDIAQETNYNGKILLDGRYGCGKEPPRLLEEFPLADEPGGTVQIISASAGNITISDGVYEIAQGYTGTITIASNAQNVKIKQANPSVELNEVFIEGPASGNANLWIENLNIKNLTDKNIIKFQGADNTLTLKGTNTLQLGDTTVSLGGSVNSALIHVGDGLTIEGTSDGILNLNLKMLETGICDSGAGIGANLTEMSTSDITINSGTINVDMHTNLTAISTNTGCTSGACIGAGGGGSIGNIYINTATVDAKGGMGACIGSGSWHSSSGDIVIDNGAYVTVRSIYYGSGIGSGFSNSTTGDITIGNATIVADAWAGAGIGSGRGPKSSVGNIFIHSGADITSTSEYGAGIGSGVSGSAGDIVMSRYAKIDAKSTGAYVWSGGVQVWRDGGDDIGAGVSGTVGDIRYMGVLNPLVIHHGTKANQALNCYINDMRTDALGLSNTKVSTRDDAIWALSNDKTGRVGAIDAAIEYALDEATTLGSYISRLEFTEENLVTANENTQSSESTIRNADMAKEMTDYTKSNVLAQSAQSMLAQANQNSSNVLSLLQ